MFPSTGIGEDEHITVLAGPFNGAFGESPWPFEPGAYVVIPAGVRHQAWYGPGTIIQVSGIGPFESIYVDPATDLRTESRSGLLPRLDTLKS